MLRDSFWVFFEPDLRGTWGSFQNSQRCRRARPIEHIGPLPKARSWFQENRVMMAGAGSWGATAIS